MPEIDRTRPDSREILDLENYAGVYGRLFFASTTNIPDALDAINPDFQMTAALVNQHRTELTGGRKDYNETLKKLSRNERTLAWQGREFEDALSDWKSQFLSRAMHTTDESRISALKMITGKDQDQLASIDVDTLYETFCRQKSDVNAFSDTVLKELSGVDGKIDPEKLEKVRKGLEWVAANLFGRKAGGEATMRIIELKAGLNNDRNQTILRTVGVARRMNNLSPEEESLLNSLFKGQVIKSTIQAQPAQGSVESAAILKPDTSPIQETAATAPETQQPTAPEATPETQQPTAIRALERQLEEINNEDALPEPVAQLATPEPQPQPAGIPEPVVKSAIPSAPEPTVEAKPTDSEPIDTITSQPLAHEEPRSHTRKVFVHGGKQVIRTDGAVFDITAQDGSIVTLTNKQGASEKIEFDDLEEQLNIPGSTWQAYELVDMEIEPESSEPVRNHLEKKEDPTDSDYLPAPIQAELV